MVHLRLKPYCVDHSSETIEQYFYVYDGRCLPFIFFYFRPKQLKTMPYRAIQTYKS